MLTPLNRVGDKEGCRRHDDGSVTTPKGFKEAYKQLTEGGWLGAAAPAEFGGQGLPVVLAQAVNEFLCSANMAFAMYPGLTQGATAALIVHGSPEQKALYVPKLVAGEWTGTMNLTEPQCGTDLGLVRTKAAKQADGSYKITRHQDFHLRRRARSGREHHSSGAGPHRGRAGRHQGHVAVRRAEIPAAADGSLGARNGVSCGSIEHKMGIHGNATCVMNYDGATGWLIGEENRGMQAMFVMMNEARLGVGVQGLAQSEVAYQNAAAYAKERLAGRRADGREISATAGRPDHRASRRAPHAADDPRLQRGGARAGGLDRAQKRRRPPLQDAKERQAADDHMGLMTPVMKGVLTDQGFANTVLAQQMFGGHGYIAEHGMEQFVRDARIAMIYEGANGIQALDLVGRKLPRDGGRAVLAFFGEVAAFAKEHGADEAMEPYVAPLGQALGHLQQATMWLMQNALGNPG